LKFEVYDYNEQLSLSYEKIWNQVTSQISNFKNQK